MIKYPFKLDFNAIGTQWWISILDENRTDLEQIAQAIQEVCSEFEQNYSRFISSSYISKLNTDGELYNFPEELFDILSLGEESRIKSLGSFNLGVGAILENLGYDKDYSFESKNKTALSKINLLGSPFVLINQDEVKLQPNSKIDLGGIGKGYLIDKIKGFLLKQGLSFFSINAGGDIYATSKHGLPFSFVLEHPLDSKMSIGQIEIIDQGLACSAPNRRYWKDKTTGQLKHHLIDLSDLDSQTGKLTVFTQAETALEADIASTAIFVANEKKIKEIASNLKVEYLIVFEDFSYTHSLGYRGVLN